MGAARGAVTVGINTCILSNRQASSTAWAGKATGLCPLVKTLMRLFAGVHVCACACVHIGV